MPSSLCLHRHVLRLHFPPRYKNVLLQNLASLYQTLVGFLQTFIVPCPGHRVFCFGARVACVLKSLQSSEVCEVQFSTSIVKCTTQSPAVNMQVSLYMSVLQHRCHSNHGIGKVAYTTSLLPRTCRLLTGSSIQLRSV